MASWNYDPIVYKKRKGSIDDPFIEYDNVPYIVKKFTGFITRNSF